MDIFSNNAADAGDSMLQQITWANNVVIDKHKYRIRKIM